MEPSLSSHRGIDLTYHGILAIWSSLAALPTSTATGGATNASSSNSASGRREPVKQNSAAWNALSNVSHPASASSSSTTAATTTKQSHRWSAEKDKHAGADITPEMEAGFNTAIEAINKVRNEEGHIGSTGSSKLPSTEYPGKRRMMLALCGENHKGVMHEVER
jgi:hypothetical protein